MFPYKSLLIGGLVALILIGGGYFVMNKKTPLKELGDSIESPYAPQLAQAGNVVQGFPNELWLNPEHKWVASYKTDLSGPDSYVLRLATSEDLSQVHSSYLKYFQSNDYKITKKTTHSIAASKEDKAFNIVFSSSKKETQITITVNQ